MTTRSDTGDNNEPGGAWGQAKEIERLSPRPMTTRTDTEGLLREALDAAATWLEVEANHPRQDPVPAMRRQAADLRAALATPPDTDHHEHVAGDKHSHPFSGPHSHGGVSALYEPDTDPSGSFVHPRLGVAALREGWNPNEATPGAGSGEWPDDPSPASLWAADTDPSEQAKLEQDTEGRLREAALTVLEAVEAALSRDNPESRWHEEQRTPSYRHSWACIPLTDAVNAYVAAIQESRAGGGLDVERLAEAWANVMDGRRMGSGLNAERIGRGTTTADDWQAIAAEYADLSPGS